MESLKVLIDWDLQHKVLEGIKKKMKLQIGILANGNDGQATIFFQLTKPQEKLIRGEYYLIPTKFKIDETNLTSTYQMGKELIVSFQNDFVIAELTTIKNEVYDLVYAQQPWQPVYMKHQLNPLIKRPVNSDWITKQGNGLEANLIKRYLWEENNYYNLYHQQKMFEKELQQNYEKIKEEQGGRIN